MTIHDLGCDVCGRMLAGLETDLQDSPARGTRLLVHPGDPKRHDNSVLVCTEPCWERLRADLGPQDREDVCAMCREAVAFQGSLHVMVMLQKFGANPTWQFCRRHGAEFLNNFLFVQPKLAEADLKLSVDFPSE